MKKTYKHLIKHLARKNSGIKKYRRYRSDIWGKFAIKHRNNFRISFFSVNGNLIIGFLLIIIFYEIQKSMGKTIFGLGKQCVHKKKFDYLIKK